MVHRDHPQIFHCLVFLQLGLLFVSTDKLGLLERDATNCDGTVGPSPDGIFLDHAYLALPLDGDLVPRARMLQLPSLVAPDRATSTDSSLLRRRILGSGDELGRDNSLIQCAAHLDMFDTAPFAK